MYTHVCVWIVKSRRIQFLVEISIVSCSPIWRRYYSSLTEFHWCYNHGLPLLISNDSIKAKELISKIFKLRWGKWHKLLSLKIQFPAWGVKGDAFACIFQVLMAELAKRSCSQPERNDVAQGPFLSRKNRMLGFPLRQTPAASWEEARLQTL